jgi:hypothetical protein
MNWKKLTIIFNAISCSEINKNFINTISIEATHHIGDSAVSACIQGVQVQLPIVHPAASF